MNEKKTLQDIVNLLCEKQGISPKEAETFVRTMFDLIEEALTNEKYVKIKGLGTFKLTEVNSRESVHVNTGERIEIQGHSKISFTPDTTMKELINKPFSHFETVVLNEGVELEDTDVEDVVETPEAETTVMVEETVIPPIEEKIAIENKEEIIEEPEPEVPIEETMVETTETEELTVEVEPTSASASTETEEEKPVSIEEKEETQTPFVPQDEEKKSSRILWGIIIALVLIILFGFYWLFMRPDTTEVAPTIPVQEKVTEPAPVVEEVKQPEDTLEIVQYVELSAEELRNERVPSLADTLDYQIVGTKEKYTLQKGETIIRASVKYFGSKKYWPYIVKHNMDVLEDPDNIPAGAQVKIPMLTPKNK